MTQQLATLPARELRLSFIGWGGYMGFLIVYCLAHQAYVALAPVDLADSLLWTLREWGIWLGLTPVISTALHHRRRLAPNPLAFYSVLIAAVLTLSLSYRVGLDVAFADGELAGSLVYFFPKYALALAIVIAGWHFLQRSQPRRQLPLSPPTETLLVSRGQTETLIRLDEILAVSAAGNYVDIHTARGTYLLRSTMKQLAERLPKEAFVRTHRSHMVRLQEIEAIERLPAGNGRVRLRSGLSVALSKGYRQALKQGADSAIH